MHCGKGLEVTVDWALAYAGRENLPLRVDDLDRRLRDFVDHADEIFGAPYCALSCTSHCGNGGGDDYLRVCGERRTISPSSRTRPSLFRNRLFINDGVVGV